MPISRPVIKPTNLELTDAERRRRGWYYDPDLGLQPPEETYKALRHPVAPEMAAWLRPIAPAIRFATSPIGQPRDVKAPPSLDDFIQEYFKANAPALLKSRSRLKPSEQEQFLQTESQWLNRAKQAYASLYGQSELQKAVGRGIPRRLGELSGFGVGAGTIASKLMEPSQGVGAITPLDITFGALDVAAVAPWIRKGVDIAAPAFAHPPSPKQFAEGVLTAPLAGVAGGGGKVNPYLKMPLARVKQDAEKGVKLAKEALESRKAEIPEVKPPVEPSKPVTPEGKVPAPETGMPEIKYTNLKPETIRRIQKLLSELPDNVKSNLDIAEFRQRYTAGGRGRYSPSTKSLTVGRDFLDSTFYHELWHHIRDTQGKKVFPGISKIKGDEESIADAFSEWARGKRTGYTQKFDILFNQPTKPSMTPEPSVPEAKPSAARPVEPEVPAQPVVTEGIADFRRGKPLPSIASWAQVPPTAGAPPVQPSAPQRIPIWQRAQTGGGTTPPPVKPAGGTSPSPTQFPSGRVPGGIARQTPYVPPDPYAQLVDALTPAKMSFKDRVTNIVESTQRNFYDNLYVGLNDLEKTTGIPAYTMARLTRGAVAAGEDNIRRLVKPILDTVSNDIPYLQQYMVAQRNMDIVARNPATRLPGGMSAAGSLQAMDRIKAKIGGARFAKIEQAANELWRKNDELILTRMKEAGLLSPEAYTRIKSANPHYIDFGRADFNIDDVSRIIKNPEASVTSTGMKTLTAEGSARKLDEPLAHTLQQYANVEVLIARNDAAKSIIEALQVAEKQTGQSLLKLLQAGEKAEHSLVTDTISTLRNGETLTYQVPRVYAIAAKGLEAEPINLFSRIATKASAPLRHGAVTYNPAFVVVNAMRDALSAWFREGLIPLSRDYIRGWTAAIMKNADFTEVAQSRVLMSGIVDTMRSTKEVTRQAGRGSLSVRSWKDAVTILPRLVAEANLTSERATRIATYYKLKGKGVPELARSLRTRDVTVDFSKSGEIMRLINQMIPFSNAGLQGTLNVVRTIRDKPAWAITATAPLVTMSIMSWVNNKRFETSNKIPAYEQSYNWVLQIGEGVENPDPKQPFKEPEKFPIYLKIPKGPMVSALTAPAELALRLAWANNDRSVLEEFLQAGQGLSTAVLPIEPSLSGLLPPLVSTAVGLETGQDVFRGQPIVPGREESLLPEQQYGAETSTLAVELGKQFKVSPRLIDFAIKDYTAGTGQMGLWLTGMAMDALNMKPEPYGEAFQKESTEVQEMAKVPLVSRFIGTRGTAQESYDKKAFHDIAEAAQRNIAKFPDITRLGVTFGEVGDTIAGATLDTKQRTQYQTLAGQYAEKELNDLFKSPDYLGKTDAEKRKSIQSALDISRDKAREEIAPTLGAINFARYQIVERGGSITQFEKQTGLKWDDPKAEKLITGAHKYLKSYWGIEEQVWGKLDPRYKELSDAIEELAQTNPTKAKEYLFKYPQIVYARKEVLLRKRAMRAQSPTLEEILGLFY